MNTLRKIGEKFGLLVQIAVAFIIISLISGDNSIGGDPGAASLME